MSDADLSRALELLESGDWRAAHEIVQKDEASPPSCWALRHRAPDGRRPA
jgi:hypothetical protein